MRLVEFLKKVKSFFVVNSYKICLLRYLLWFYDLFSQPSWFFDKRARLSVSKLSSFKNKFRDGRCFIIATGPSINKLNLKSLRKEITFGLNRLYLKFPEMGYETNFFVSVNSTVLEQFGGEMSKIKGIKFFSWKARDLVKADENTIFLRTVAYPHFSRDITKGVWEGGTVTFVALQIAYFMGFKEVFLLGVDHSYSQKGEPHKLVVSDSEDASHFSRDYFGKGVNWELPNLEMSEYAYSLAREAFDMACRKVVNVTSSSNLKIFPRSSFNKLFKQFF